MLITCPKCGKYLSEEAKACPVCGHILQKATAAPQAAEKPKTITAEDYDATASDCRARSRWSDKASNSI